MVKQFFILSAKRFIMCLLMSVLLLADISAHSYQSRNQNAYPSRYRQSSTQNQRPLDAYSSSYRQSSSQYQRNGSTRREYSNPFSGEESRQISPSISDNTSDDVELVVTGDGPTKEKATLSALRSALEQVYGTMVSSNTKILNDELVKDEIVSISTGIVKKYTYLSEKEVGGRFYVVVKALVTPQKLITSAKQKGASTELAGATFAANVRIQKLNEENKRIASRNITEMQSNILPKCLDFSIIEIKEPQHHHWDPDDVFWVEFKLRVCLNSNAKIIQDLEKDKPTYNRGNVEQTLKTIFCQFKIEDDINEYIPIFETRYNQNRKAEYTLSFAKRSKDNASNSIYVEMETGNGHIREVCNDVTYFMCDSKGEISDVYRNYPKDNFISFNNVKWKYATPNRPIVTIPMRIRYTLNDLDRITGIKVTPKDLSEESTSHNPSKNVSLATRTEVYLDVFNWDYIYSNYNDEQFEAFLKEQEKSLKKSPHNSDDDVKYILNALRDKYRSGKGK